MMQGKLLAGLMRVSRVALDEMPLMP